MSHRAPRTADNDLRAALGQQIGRPSTEEDWRLASLGVAAGGLGARCAAEHAPAAYVAIFSACRELCGRLWPAFDPFDLDDGCRSVATEDALRGTISCGANIYAVSDSPSQKSLSGMVEAQSVSALFGGPTLPRHRRLYLEACRVPGAGAWLTANLSCIDSHTSSPFFRVALQRRLRIPLWDRDTACSKCGEVLDRWGDPAFACCCGGDRVFAPEREWSAPRSLSSRRSRLSLRSLAFFSPRGPRSWWSSSRRRPLFCFFPVPHCWSPPCRCLGSQGCPASLKPGISRFRRCFAPLTSLLLFLRLPMSSTKWRPGSSPSRTRLLLWLSEGPPFARLSWRLADCL